MSPLPGQVPLLGPLLGGLEERPAVGCADTQAEEGKGEEAQLGRVTLVVRLVVEGQGGWEDGHLRDQDEVGVAWGRDSFKTVGMSCEIRLDLLTKDVFNIWKEFLALGLCCRLL